MSGTAKEGTDTARDAFATESDVGVAGRDFKTGERELGVQDGGWDLGRAG